MSIEGEGVVTIQATLTDYADNISFIWVRYKVDKTGPQIVITGMSESSDETHYQGTVNLSADVFKNDSAVNTSVGTQFINPMIASYENKHVAVTQNTGHTRNPLHTIYFKNTDTTPFTVNVTASDTYQGYLASSAAGGSYSGPLVADVLEMELRDAAGSANL